MNVFQIYLVAAWAFGIYLIIWTSVARKFEAVVLVLTGYYFIKKYGVLEIVIKSNSPYIITLIGKEESKNIKLLSAEYAPIKEIIENPKYFHKNITKNEDYYTPLTSIESTIKELQKKANRLLIRFDTYPGFVRNMLAEQNARLKMVYNELFS